MATSVEQAVLAHQCDPTIKIFSYAYVTTLKKYYSLGHGRFIRKDSYCRWSTVESEP